MIVAEHAWVIRPPADLIRDQPVLGRIATDLALRYAHRELVTENMLQAMGDALWRSLDAAVDLEQARASAGIKILPVVVESSQPVVLQLPWETLHHPELGFLGRDPAFALSRRPAPPLDPTPVPERSPLRVLLFTSLPEDLDPERGRLDVEGEQAAVQEALTPWVAEGRVDLRMPNDGRLATLAAEIRSFQPHVVFLSGHGRFVHQPLADEAAHGVFIFEGLHGESDPVPDTRIADAFVGSGVQCLVLSACESGKATSDALNSGLSRRLSLRGVPHVVGMRESVLDRAGIQFARAFCDSLARQERVDVAVQAARGAITRPLEGGVPRNAKDAASVELSLGQWCLPMLLSTAPGRPLIDWGFQPEQPSRRPANQSLDTVTLPPRFLGRRKELRALEGELSAGTRCRLLITGPGGQGKTALAGKLAQGLQQAGWEVFAWSARPENPWEDFRFELEFALSKENANLYSRMEGQCRDDECRAKLLLRLLMAQSGNRLVLLLDNLESLQRRDTLALEDNAAGATLKAWITAAKGLSGRGLVLLLTSRWRLPDWPEEDHWALEHASYGDFLQQARALRLPATFYRDRDRLRQAYRVLHGNWRGLEFFAAAVSGMDAQAEEVFLERLAEAEAEVQADMALGTVIAHRTDGERALLERLPAYRTPVPVEGIVKLALDLPEPECLLEGLLAVSLVEQREATDLLTREYQCSPLVAEWLRRCDAPPPQSQWLKVAADYQVYLYRHERPSLAQAAAAHEALQMAGEQAAADRLALYRIVKALNRAGLYATLLSDWLPTICRSQEPSVRAEGLGQTGKQYLHIGDYPTALTYLEQALAIQQEIGDRAGEGATLNNIATTYHAIGDYPIALTYLEQALAIQQEIGERAGEGATLNNISQIYDARGDYEGALTYLKQSLAIRREIGDRSGEGTTLNNISAIFRARGDYETALTYLKQALAIQQEIGDRLGEGVALDNIAMTYRAIGDYETALTYLKQALAIRQEIGHRSGEGTTLNNIAATCHAISDYETALTFLRQALAIQQEIGDRLGEGATLNNISEIIRARGDYATALTYLKQALAIVQEIGHRSGEGTTLNNISAIFRARGDYETALTYLKQALAIQQEIGDRSGEGATLNNISEIIRARGDYATALTYLKQALAIVQEIGDRLGEGVALNNISQIYDARGDYETALTYLKQALAIQQEIGDRLGEGVALNNISQIYDARGDYETALTYLKQALAIHQEVGNRSGEGTTLNNISQIFRARGDDATALTYVKQALAIQQEVGDAAGLCATFLNMGHIHWQNGQQAEAIAAWVTVYRLVHSTNLAEGLDALEGLAAQLGLQGGMDGWKALARQLDGSGSGGLESH
jgi:tetratricopeptide (TPR) repeat protein